MSIHELPAGIVTVADLYREVSATRTDVAQAMERLAVADALSKRAEFTSNDHEVRIRTLERFKWQMLGAASAVSVVSGIVTSYFMRR
jgi:hypothetical protein